MPPVLQLKNLTKAYGTHIAVDNVSLTLQLGEILALMGSSGSGKSTIARLITRLEEADSGEILLEGEDITGLQGQALRSIYHRLQLVFQDHIASFNPRRTIGYGIGEAWLNQGKGKAETAVRVAELLTRCGLPAELAERYPHQLSGGQCQRAAIARALIHEPKVIILDEATSALDVTVQQEILTVLTRLQREQGLAYLFICHNPALVKGFCHRVAVLQQGRLVGQGEVAQVFAQPQSPHTKALLESVLSL